MVRFPFKIVNVSGLFDKKFVEKLHKRMQNSAAQVLEGVFKGAASLRTVLRAVTNLVTLKW